jgi:hypothetical protein
MIADRLSRDTVSMLRFRYNTDGGTRSIAGLETRCRETQALCIMEQKQSKRAHGFRERTRRCTRVRAADANGDRHDCDATAEAALIVIRESFMITSLRKSHGAC